ncbi:MAG: hypothetical protein QXO21_00085 [Candidatus Anstonellales archaeon]
MDNNIENLLQEILQKLEKVEHKSTNGHNDKLLLKLELVEKNQMKTAEEIDKIHNSIYDHETGIFARLKSLEKSGAKLESFVDKYEEKISNYDKILEQLIKISGNNLQELENLIQLRKTGTKLLWVITTSSVAMVLKVIFDIIMK